MNSSRALITTNVKNSATAGKNSWLNRPPGGGIEEDENLAVETGCICRRFLPARTAFPTPCTTPRKAGRNSGWWVFLFLFPVDILAIMIAAVAFWTPISKNVTGYTDTPTPIPGTPSAVIVKTPVSSLLGDTPASKNTPTSTRRRARLPCRLLHLRWSATKRRPGFSCHPLRRRLRRVPGQPPRF